MLRIQGAHSTSFGGAPGPGLPDAGVLPAATRARTAPRFGGTRTAADVVGRVRADLRAARSGGVVRPWITPATIGVVLVLVFAWTVLQVISAGPLIAWDWAAREWVYARRAQGGMATFLEIQAFVTGERWATVPVVMGAGALVAHRQGGLRPLYAVMGGLVTIAAIGYPVKFGLGRSSPVTGVDLLHAGGQAFPSGHAANTAFTATMVVFLLYGSAGLRPDPRRFRQGIAFVCGLLAVSGPLVAWMGYHWLSDIPAGWLMGFVAVCVSLTILHWPDRGEGATETEAAAEITPASRIVVGPMSSGRSDVVRSAPRGTDHSTSDRPPDNRPTTSPTRARSYRTIDHAHPHTPHSRPAIRAGRGTSSD